ncbi:MAG: putative monooxygenase [Myxococcales bacterium]|nr:putative monooxygenase [Myxococcales bacterium]
MTDRRARVAIIGAGFGGLGMAIALRRAGDDDFVILEKGDDVGGCWRENSYPGAACDVPSHLYSFSFEPKFDWSRRYAPQAEIFAYLRHCADKYGLRPHIRFGTEVRAADFDATEGRWRITTGGGEVISARALVSACGQLSRPALPRLDGLETFGGVTFHSARWNHDYELTGKRVAVVGTGASAVQFVPEIVPRVAQLSLFQRSAPYVIPKPDRVYGAISRALLGRVPGLLALSRGRVYARNEARGLALLQFPSLLRLYVTLFRRHLARNISDPRLRARLTPDYPMGCKRILISNDYYPALAQPHVEVVTEEIERVVPRGIVTRDGRTRAVDAIIFGTGFTATQFLAPMAVRGLGGRLLDEAWRAGAEAYLGMTVSGFPNLFLLYGPNTNLGHNSIVYMLESQIAYVMQCLQALDAQELRYLDVRADVQHSFNEALQEQLERSVWASGCTSWYQTADGKQTNNWPGFTFTYRRRTRRPDFNAFAKVSARAGTVSVR